MLQACIPLCVPVLPVDNPGSGICLKKTCNLPE